MCGQPPQISLWNGKEVPFEVNAADEAVDDSPVEVVNDDESMDQALEEKYSSINLGTIVHELSGLSALLVALWRRWDCCIGWITLSTEELTIDLSGTVCEERYTANMTGSEVAELHIFKIFPASQLLHHLSEAVDLPSRIGTGNMHLEQIVQRFLTSMHPSKLSILA